MQLAKDWPRKMWAHGGTEPVIQQEQRDKAGGAYAPMPLLQSSVRRYQTPVFGKESMPSSEESLFFKKQLANPHLIIKLHLMG